MARAQSFSWSFTFRTTRLTWIQVLVHSLVVQTTIGGFWLVGDPRCYCTSFHVIVALEHTYLHPACCTDHIRWFRLMCRHMLMSYRFSCTGHIRWLRLAYYFTLIFTPGLHISVLKRYDTTYLVLLSLCIVLYIYIVLFSGNYTGFTARGYNVFRRFLLKLYFQAHSPLFFAPPGFSCWKFVTTRILGESQYRWLPLRVWSLPTLLYFIYALTSRVKWVHSLSQHNLVFRHF